MSSIKSVSKIIPENLRSQEVNLGNKPRINRLLCVKDRARYRNKTVRQSAVSYVVNRLSSRPRQLRNCRAEQSVNVISLSRRFTELGLWWRLNSGDFPTSSSQMTGSRAATHNGNLSLAVNLHSELEVTSCYIEQTLADPE